MSFYISEPKICNMDTCIRKVDIRNLSVSDKQYFLELFTDYDGINDVGTRICPSFFIKTMQYINPEIVFAKYIDFCKAKAARIPFCELTVLDTHMIFDISDSNKPVSVGHITVSNYIDEKPMNLLKEQLLEINLFIRKPYANRGIATELARKYMSSMTKRYDDIIYCFSVRASNTAAHKLAARIGATYVHRFTKMEDCGIYDNPVDFNLFILNKSKAYDGVSLISSE